MDDVLAKQGRKLEDEFFARKDALLLEKLRELERMEHTQKTLSAVSGITNSQILKRLVELDIHADLLASLTVVPLVEVAWADGSVQEKERAAILKGAEGSGFGRGTVDYVLLEEWLKNRPPPAMLEAWMHYMRGLCEILTPAERAELKTDLLSRAHTVAEAAGGFLGLTSKVSPEEKAAIATMESVFAVPSS